MRKILLLATVLLAVACEKTARPSFNDGLAAFLQTRSDVPLEGTVWEHQTGEKYNRYVSFHNSEMSLFYGLVEAEGLHRYSDFYSSPYALKGGLVVTELSYPLWGHREVTESVSVVKKQSSYTIDIDGKDYRYYGPWTNDLEEMWMTITVNVAPWSYE